MPRPASVIVCDVLDQPRDIEEFRHRNRFLGLLVDHDRRPDAAIRMATAGHLAPVAVRPVGQVGEIRKRAEQRQGEPVAVWLGEAHLFLHVIGQVRQSVALAEPPFGARFFVAARERNRLEREKRDLLRVVHRKTDDRPDLVVVDPVDERDHEDDLDPRLVHVLDGAQLHVKQVADVAVAVGIVPDAVKLQVSVAQTRVGRLARKLDVLRKADAVGRALHAVVAQLSRVLDRPDEVRRKSRLAAGELHRHLAARFDPHRVVQDLLDFLPVRLMHETDLVGIRETRVTHHVAAIGKVDSQDSATSVCDARRAVTVELRVVVGAHVAPREIGLDPPCEPCVHGHDVFILPVLGAFLHHPDLPVPFDDLGLDLAGFLLGEEAIISFVLEDLASRLDRADRAERSGFPREAEVDLASFPTISTGAFPPTWE